jgi:hypothetical protein
VNASKLKNVGIAAILVACVAGASLVSRAQTPPAASQPAPDQPVAVINGHDIDNKKFNQLLMEVAGLRVFQDVLDWTIVQQACDQAGIETQGDKFTALWRAEYERELARLPIAADVPKEDRPKILAQFLQRQNISEVQFQMVLQKTAGLRALAQGHVDVTDDEVKREFESEYGEKVDVRVLTVKNLTEAGKVRDAIENDKKDPNDVAHDMNIPIQPVTISKNADADQIEQLKTIAFELKDKQLSAAIPMKGVYFMVYLDKKEPAQTDVKFSSVKDKVRKDVMEAKESQWMSNHLLYLRQNARVTVNDPVLRAQFQAIAAQVKAQQDAAATQGAATQPK